MPTPPPRQRVRGDQEFIFRGSGGGPVHRAGPEHFRLTQAADGKPVRLAVAYDRERLAEQEERTGTPRVVKKVRALRAREVLRYNSLFKGVRFFLESGSTERKDEAGRAGYLDLFGRAELKPGVRYRLTWACWPVGASEATEVSCEFTASE